MTVSGSTTSQSFSTGFSSFSTHCHVLDRFSVTWSSQYERVNCGHSTWSAVVFRYGCSGISSYHYTTNSLDRLGSMNSYWCQILTRPSADSAEIQVRRIRLGSSLYLSSVGWSLSSACSGMTHGAWRGPCIVVTSTSRFSIHHSHCCNVTENKYSGLV